ncbi:MULTISPECIES: ParB/RepB/Spo0J family partition protein [Sorangium]|uniref:ParB/RepB/Spo0J family partition protein n=1 Tax=Sorangium TaxID=39643 RepID=UPI003D9C5B82
MEAAELGRGGHSGAAGGTIAPVRSTLQPAYAAWTSAVYMSRVCVADTSELISGRFEAVRALGRDEVLALLMGVTYVQAAMVEVDENLVRIELTALERAEHIHRRKELYEAMHPEAKHGDAPGEPGGGKQKSKGERAASITADMAQKTGLSPRSVQEDVQVAKMTPEAKRVVNGTPLEDRKSELLALARLPKEKQAMTARAVASGEAATAAEALQKPHGKE